MAGRPPEETFPSSRPSQAEAVLTVEGLRVRPGTPPVSFTLRRGQILGLAGLVGSGRSSLLRSLFGLSRAAAGKLVTPRGRFAAGRLDPRRARAAGLEFLSEDRKEEGLALGLSVRANVTLPVLARFRRGRAPWLDLGREAEEARAACDALRMRYGHVDQAVGNLSGGNQQKAALARLMLGGAEVWLLDEPTRGVDVGSRSEIYRLVAEEAGRGRAVIWAGSYLPELMGLCDTLAVLHRGTLSPMRPVAEWTETAAMAWAVFGKAGA
jgi:ribose transport system ATP-binding protein